MKNDFCSTTFQVVAKLLIISIVVSCKSPEKVKLEQFYVNGQELYEQNCANCHQKDGLGFKDLYPPIAGSDYLKNKEAVICMIRNGASGEMTVNGKVYNQQMPANAQLYDLDIAAITTYIYNKWGNESAITETDSVKKVLQRCGK